MPDANAARRAPRSLCVVIRDLGLGGTSWLYVDLLSRAVRQGIRSTLVAAPGPLYETAARAGIELVDVDWSDPRVETYDVVARATHAHDVGVLLCDPALVHSLAAVVASCDRALLALHSDARGIREWFGEPALSRLASIAQSLVASPGTAVIARGLVHRNECARLLDVEEWRLPIFTPGVAVDRIGFDTTGGEPGRVVVLTRLSPELAPRVHAGIELVAAGLVAGRDCRLELVGDGPWRDGALEACRARLPEDRWRCLPATLDPVAGIRAGSLAIGTGLTTLEAVAAGRPVVVARRTNDGAGVVGPLVTPQRYDLVAEDIHSVAVPAVEPDRVWTELDSLDEADLAELRRKVETRSSGDAQLASLLALLGRLDRGGDRPQLLAAVGNAAAALEDELVAARTVADQLWEAREWYEDQLRKQRAPASSTEG
jgi:hypothetical protein